MSKRKMNLINVVNASLIVSILLLSACAKEASELDSSVEEAPVYDLSSEAAGSRSGDRALDVPAANKELATLSAEEHCKAVIASVSEAGFDDEAWVSCNYGRALIHSDSYPDHKVMEGVVGTNEQIPWPAPGYFAPVKFNPAFSGVPQNRDSSMAVAVNGIPIFDYTVGGNLDTEDLFYHQPHLDAMTRQEIDSCGGHAGKGDDYHYHELPSCMLEQMDNKDDNPIIGWGFDGFPLYGNDNPDGSPIAQGVLDVCNGQLDPVFGYRYHTSDEQPYIIQCLAGEIDDLSFAPSVGMVGVGEITRRPASDPVRVEDLTFTESESGAAKLTYNYLGEPYYMSVEPTDDPACYIHSWNVIGNERNPGGE